MKKSGGEFSVNADIAVEALLERAAPRPVPPGEDEELVRDAVHAEWLAVTNNRRIRRRTASLAVAATVVLAVAATFSAVFLADVAPQQVAAINKSHGSIYLLGEQSELYEMVDFSSILAGQTIVTGNGSGLGLAWSNSGSLRIDQNTRIEFLSTDTVYLRSGRIYFDSTPSGLIAGGPGGHSETTFIVETEHGVVTHLGTQYMAYSDSELLSLSVREGRVALDGTFYDETAEEGEQLTVRGSARPNIVNMQPYGDAWDWIEATSPVASLDGRTVYEFLGWVGRETGLKVEYMSDAAEATAREGTLKGTVNQKPTKALDFWLQGEILDWVIEEGVIKVSAAESVHGP